MKEEQAIGRLKTPFGEYIVLHEFQHVASSFLGLLETIEYGFVACEATMLEGEIYPCPMYIRPHGNYEFITRSEPFSIRVQDRSEVPANYPTVMEVG